MKPTLLLISSLAVLLANDASNLAIAAECSSDDWIEAEAIALQSASQIDPLESSLTLMQALRRCKKYEWWMALGRLQGVQDYWHEAADAYGHARDFITTDENGALSAEDIEHQALANQALAQAFWRSKQKAEALVALEESRVGFEVIGRQLPENLMTLQGEIDDAFSVSDASLLAETLSLQRSRSVRGIGVRPKLKGSESAVALSAATAEPSTAQAHVNVQVLFASGSDQPTPDGQSRIAQMAGAIDRLKLDVSHIVLVVGHTDTRGTEEFNLDLSRRRAENVLAGLQKAITTTVDLKAIGRGESQPRYPDTTPDAHRRNRRVELIIQNKN